MTEKAAEDDTSSERSESAFRRVSKMSLRKDRTCFCESSKWNLVHQSKVSPNFQNQQHKSSTLPIMRQ